MSAATYPANGEKPYDQHLKKYIDAGAVGRGTLYLKASCTDLDVSASSWSADGSGLPYVLDSARMPDGLPDWADQVGGVPRIIEWGVYLCNIAAKGVLTSPTTPGGGVFIDLFDSGHLSTKHLSWYSDGSAGFGYPVPVPGTTSALAFNGGDAASFTLISGGLLPLSLTGLAGDNGAAEAGQTLTLNALIAITRIGSGAVYVEGDL